VLTDPFLGDVAGPMGLGPRRFVPPAIRAERALGMHWGTIMLTPEDPFDAPRRFLAAALEQGFGAEKAWILKIGESRSLTW
jgi:L-ascorbate metabolism protein UlaG (beta-lactamase superfamily)